MNKSPIKEILIEYISGIKRFEFLMKEKYNLSCNPWNVRNVFERIGTIGEYSYHYHGGGCRLDCNGIIYEYNVGPLNGKEIKFTIHKFEEFIQTHPLYKNLNYTEEYIELELFSLLEEGLLSYMMEYGIVYQVYQVEEDKWQII